MPSSFKDALLAMRSDALQREPGDSRLYELRHIDELARGCASPERWMSCTVRAMHDLESLRSDHNIGDIGVVLLALREGRHRRGPFLRSFRQAFGMLGISPPEIGWALKGGGVRVPTRDTCVELQMSGLPSPAWSALLVERPCEDMGRRFIWRVVWIVIGNK